MRAFLKTIMFTAIIILTGLDINYAEDTKKIASKDTVKVEGFEKMKDNKDTLTDQQIVNMTDKDWKKILSPEAYHITREKGTERAFTGKYWDHFEEGTYQCVACGMKLFDSSTKFESGCGWPSFSEAIAQGNIEERKDSSFGMMRTEVVCKKCGAHLGHVFEDGPPPTGLRYCINSAALKFVEKDSD